MSACQHVAALPPEPAPSTTAGCEDCLAAGTSWVHLRECLTCGKVGCCDSSPQRHASRHGAAAEHPVIRSFERASTGAGASWTGSSSEVPPGPGG